MAYVFVSVCCYIVAGTFDLADGRVDIKPKHSAINAAADAQMDKEQARAQEEVQARRVTDPRFDPTRFKTDVRQQLQEREATRRAEKAVLVERDRALVEAMVVAAAEEERRRKAELEKRREETRKQMAEFEALRRLASEARLRQVGGCFSLAVGCVYTAFLILNGVI